MASDCVRGRIIYFTLESQEKNNMRKTLLLATILLLGSVGAAQAQATIARVNLLTSTERAAREGGKTEAAGDVFLDISGSPESIASYTLTYSVPVVDSQAVMGLPGVVLTENDLGKGLVAFGPLTGGTDTVVAITGVTLDVSKAGLRAGHGNACVGEC